MLPLLHVGVGGPRWLDWAVHPDALLLCLALGWGYYYAITELRRKISDAGRVKRSQVVTFYLGLAALFLAGGTPIHDLGEEYLLSAHMVQHMLFTFVAPPLLIVGTPTWLWQTLLCRPKALPVTRRLTHPLMAFGLFNAVTLLTHLPSVVDLALNVGAFHFFVHATLVATAMLMWWPILSSVPELPRLSYPLQMGYLFVQSLLPTVIAAFITFADSVVYPFYAEAPRLWDISPIHDQQMAGLIMKIAGSLILWTFIAVAFFKWYEREEAEAKGLRWEEVAEELEELGLTKR